jgi:hypothetical protein
MYGKILTYGWVQTFLARHTELIMARTIHPKKILDCKFCSKLSLIILTSSAATFMG